MTQPDPVDSADAGTVADLRDRPGLAGQVNAEDIPAPRPEIDLTDLYSGGTRRFYANLLDT